MLEQEQIVPPSAAGCRCYVTAPAAAISLDDAGATAVTLAGRSARAAVARGMLTAAVAAAAGVPHLMVVGAAVPATASSAAVVICCHCLAYAVAQRT